MNAWVIPPRAEMCDPVMAPEIYVDGIGAIEISGDNIRIHLISEQMGLGENGAAGQVVVVKIVGPMLNVPKVIGQLAQCLWREPLRPVKGPWPRAVT